MKQRSSSPFALKLKLPSVWSVNRILLLNISPSRFTYNHLKLKIKLFCYLGMALLSTEAVGPLHSVHPVSSVAREKQISHFRLAFVKTRVIYLVIICIINAKMLLQNASKSHTFCHLTTISLMHLFCIFISDYFIGSK